MKYILKTELNENGNEIFSKVRDVMGFYYIVKNENGAINYKDREWVIKNSKNILNLILTSDLRLMVKSKKTEPAKEVKKKEKKGMTVSEFKKRQLEVILKHNKMTDDYHVGIRSINDIKLFSEVINDEESFYYGDFESDDARYALKRGRVVVYSSRPITMGSFVSTSRNMAKDYAGGGQIYEQEVLLTDVAWINGDEGQYAKVM